MLGSWVGHDTDGSSNLTEDVDLVGVHVEADAP